MFKYLLGTKIFNKIKQATLLYVIITQCCIYIHNMIVATLLYIRYILIQYLR